MNLTNEDKCIELEVDLNGLYWRLYFEHFFAFNVLSVSFFMFFLFGMTFLFFSLNYFFTGNYLVQLIVPAVVFSILFSSIGLYSSANNAKKTALGLVKYEFNNEKVELSTPEFSSSIDWKYFGEIRETGKYFFLKMKNGQKLMLPKNAFADAEQLVGFKDLVQAKLGKQAFLKKSKENLGLK